MSVLCLGGLIFASGAFAQTGHPLGWGLNYDFQCSPVPTNTMDDADAVAGGSYHSFSIKDGRVWAWGNNDSGQTIVPAEAQSDVLEAVGGANFSMALKSDGRVVAWGSPFMVTNFPVDASNGVSQVAAGQWHAAVLKNGGIIAWGSNNYNQCDVPTSLTSGVTQVDAGAYYTMALKDGGVQVFGINATNELAGDIRSVPDAATNGVSQIAAGKWHALALKDGGVIAWGTPYGDATNVPAGALSNVTDIAAGDLFSMALKSDGTIEVWGEIFNGQLPLPSYATNGINDIAAGNGHCLALCPVMPPRFMGESLPDAYMDEEYNGAIFGAGDPAVTYHTFGSWPPWMTLDENTGEIGGVFPTDPESNSSYRVYFSAIISNAYGRLTNNYQITAFERPEGPPVFVTTNPLPDGIVNDEYNLQIVVSNSATFSLVSGEGELPQGLTMTTNGLISGIPTLVEDRFFTVRATNLAGGVSNTYNLSIKAPSNPPVFVTTSPLPAGEVGVLYSNRLVASNGALFSLQSGSLPDGLTLYEHGLIMGTPTGIENANFTVLATNSAGTDSRNFDLEIVGPPVFLTDSPLPDAILGSAYNQQIQALGDPSFSLIAGDLPNGVSLNAAGLVTGIPVEFGDFNFTVHATNDWGWSNRVYDLTVNQAPVFSTTNPLPDGTIAVYYQKQIEASGTPTFSVVAGAVPSGLNLNSAGLLNGIPQEAGNFNFTVNATNASGWSNRVFDLYIENFIQPSFTYISAGDSNVILHWTNANAAGSVEVWRTPSITTNPVPWSSLGAQTSPWTNTEAEDPSYYQLRMTP